MDPRPRVFVTGAEGRDLALGLERYCNFVVAA
jgi:hypothetical protein